MARRVCQRCNGNRTIVVWVNNKREVIICPKCGGSGEEEIESVLCAVAALAILLIVIGASWGPALASGMMAAFTGTGQP